MLLTRSDSWGTQQVLRGRRARMLCPYRSILGLTTEATEVHREKDNDNSKLSSLPLSDSPLCSSVFSVVHLLLILYGPQHRDRTPCAEASRPVSHGLIKNMLCPPCLTLPIPLLPLFRFGKPIG